MYDIVLLILIIVVFGFFVCLFFYIFIKLVICVFGYWCEVLFKLKLVEVGMLVDEIERIVVVLSLVNFDWKCFFVCFCVMILELLLFVKLL